MPCGVTCHQSKVRPIPCILAGETALENSLLQGFLRFLEQPSVFPGTMAMVLLEVARALQPSASYL